MTPLLIIVWKGKEVNNDAIQNLQELEKTIKDTATKKDNLKIDDLRKIQDRIFYSRISNLLIPDFFYRYFRRNLEDSMLISVRNNITTLTQTP